MADDPSRADYLFLIYTTRGENWDWCVYEAAYFAGRRGAEQTSTLVVLHPPGVLPPAPLATWQSVATEPKKLLDFFKRVFEVGNPTCHFDGVESDLEKMAKEISDAIAPLKSESFRPNRCVSIIVPPPGENASASVCEDLPDGTYVQLNRRTADLLKLQPNPRYPWREFRQAVAEFHFDVETLAIAVGLARTHRAVPESLALFRAPSDGAGYRPLVYNAPAQHPALRDLERNGSPPCRNSGA